MKRILFSMTIALLLLPVSSWGQQKGSIELKSLAEVEVTEVNAKGEKEMKRVDASKSKVLPGDVVIYTTMYRNIGKEPADRVAISNPIPQHMDYIDGSAEGSGTKIEFSVDHGKTYGSPDTLMITDAQGKNRHAGPKDYTDIRWTIGSPLPPAGKGSVSFKARLQ